MAGFFKYTAILDACVLYPAPLRDLLLSLATDDLFHPRWTHLIHDEWIRNLSANRPDLPLASLQKTATMMNQAIDDCLVQNFEELIPALTLPDPDDRHVLAAAIGGHADAIITFNLKDFPANGVRDIEILHPDDFLLAQYELNKIKFLKSVKKMRERLRKPPKSAEDLILTLEKQGLPQTAEILRAAAELI